MVLKIYKLAQLIQKEENSKRREKLNEPISLNNGLH